MAKSQTGFIKIFKNFGLAALIFLLIAWLSTFAIGWFTKHGQQIDVPDVKGMSIENAQAELDKQDFHFEVVDSIYNEDFKKNAITDQDPASGSKVKKGRTIYLTVNASSKPKVKM
ncbi:MAG: PASTA domain-containing protein, partial [Bacteroidia bacterium]|nr:PASTA domain-containing protein [Bacteroidia bacterium]